MNYMSLNEGEYWGPAGERTKELDDAFDQTDAGRDLYALGVRKIRERDRIKYERRGYNQSMPRTAAYKDEATGKFHIEHYSSKPGLEIYGEKDFDTPEELYRHLWMRLAKNLIPASLVSKRDAEKRINLEELFPIGHRVSQEGFFDRIKPFIGGEELNHPSNQDLVGTETVQELLKLGLIGKGTRYNANATIAVVNDISKNEIVKYRFYCKAAQVARNIYSPLITQIIGAYEFRACSGTMVSRSQDYESWTVTNTNRIPLNSVNFRSGENTLRCHVQDNDMMAAVFLSIIKRTFKRAKGSNWAEKILAGGNNTALIEEMNSLLSDYFFQAASNLDQTVFFEEEYHQNETIIHNANALLIKYLMTNGSQTIKDLIKGNTELEPLVKFATWREDLTEFAKKLIRLIKSLKYS